MRSRCFSTLFQRLLPSAIRIPPGAVACHPVSPATAFAIARESIAPVPVAAPPAPPPAELPEGTAVELCNFLHRVGLGVRGLRGVEGATKDARSMGLALEQMRQRLKAEQVEFADLTGQPWSPERADFECTGKPRAKLGLDAAVIESCEYPAVTVRGALVQKARGEAIRPPHAGTEE